MPGLILTALEPAESVEAARRRRYPVRFGPLRFAAVVGDSPESVGDKLESVGATIVAGERTPRPAQLTLAVRGSVEEVDDRASGFALRRQVRALLNNAAWRPHGLFWSAGYDPDVASWLAVAGGELTEQNRGPTFGDWRLQLSDAFLIGRPATHRRARRITVTDRGSGSYPSDSRRLLFTDDLGAVAPSPPAPCIPGDVVGITGYRDRDVDTAAGPTVTGRILWRTVTDPIDGELVSWRPDLTVVGDLPDREAAVEDPGTVRAWTTGGDLWANTPQGDLDPDVGYDWERLVGELADHAAFVAVDNGRARIRWRGTHGLQLERWDDTLEMYLPVARVLHRAGVVEVTAHEITAERALIGWRAGGHELRAELRRGWGGPRLESYAPAGQTAALRIAAEGGGRTAPHALVDRIAAPGTAVVAAKSHAAVTWGASTGLFADEIGTWSAPRVLALQTDLRDAAPADVLTHARWDVRATPTLIGR